MRFRSAALVVAALFLASCTATPAPRPVAKEVEPPRMPPPAREDSPQGATSFATYWLDLVEYGRRSMDADPIRGLGLPSCETCDRLITQLDKDKAAGTRYSGGGIRLLGAEPSGYRKHKRAKVTAVFDEEALVVKDKAGKRVDKVPAGSLMFIFELTWTDEGWRAAHVRLGIPKNQK